MDLVGDGVFEYTIAIPDGAEFKFIGPAILRLMGWVKYPFFGEFRIFRSKGDNDNIKSVIGVVTVPKSPQT